MRLRRGLAIRCRKAAAARSAADKNSPRRSCGATSGPSKAQRRQGTGDCEGDLIVGRRSQSATGTPADRSSRYLRGPADAGVLYLVRAGWLLSRRVVAVRRLRGKKFQLELCIECCSQAGQCPHSEVLPP